MEGKSSGRREKEGRKREARGGRGKGYAGSNDGRRGRRRREGDVAPASARRSTSGLSYNCVVLVRGSDLLAITSDSSATSPPPSPSPPPAPAPSPPLLLLLLTA